MQEYAGPNWLRRARQAATGAGLVAGGMVLSAVGIAYYVARVLTDPRRPGPMDDYVMTPFETGADYEEVRFPSETGDHMVPGWWFPRPETHRVIVGCTGYRGSKSELIGIATTLWRAGFNVLIFDYHGHGAARGAPVTLAYREVRDFYGALNYVSGRVPNATIGVIGYSMGAAVAIMGSAHRPEVSAVVADSPFATHEDVISHNVERILHVYGRPVTSIADYFLRAIAGYSSSDVAPVRDAAAISPRPLLIIHGTADETIPVRHARQIYDAALDPKELWLVEGAGHCGAYFADRPAYCARVIDFLRQNLSEQRPHLLPAAYQQRSEDAS